MAKAMLAEHRNSLTSWVMIIGRPCPPNSGGAEMPIQPPSTICLNASLKPVGVAWQVGVAIDVEDVVEKKLDVLDRRLVGRHGVIPARSPRVPPLSSRSWPGACQRRI